MREAAADDFLTDAALALAALDAEVLLRDGAEAEGSELRQVLS